MRKVLIWIWKYVSGRYCGYLSSCLTPLSLGPQWSLPRATDAGCVCVDGGRGLVAHLTNLKCLTEFWIEVALRHLGHVILVQELTLVPLLAQPPKPVFAHHCLLAADVAKWAHAPCQGRHGGVRREPRDTGPVGAKVPSPHTSLKHPKAVCPGCPRQKATWF